VWRGGCFGLPTGACASTDSWCDLSDHPRGASVRSSIDLSPTGFNWKGLRDNELGRYCFFGSEKLLGASQQVLRDGQMEKKAL